MTRNVYVRPVTYSVRKCHMCDIFGRIRHTLQSNMEHKMCHIRLDLVFLCSPKRICHLLKMRIKIEKKQRICHMCILSSTLKKNKSSSCAHCRLKTLTFFIFFFDFLYCFHTWPQQPFGQGLQVH